MEDNYSIEPDNGTGKTHYSDLNRLDISPSVLSASWKPRMSLALVYASNNSKVSDDYAYHFMLYRQLSLKASMKYWR